MTYFIVGNLSEGRTEYEDEHNDAIRQYVNQKTRGIITDDTALFITLGDTHYSIGHDKETGQLIQVNIETGYKRRVRRRSTQ